MPNKIVGRPHLMEKKAIVLLCIAAWMVPGAGHLWLQRKQKGLVFLLILLLMFTSGLWLEGQLFPFDPFQPFVMLASIAELGIGVMYFVSGLAGYGTGSVVAVTYEYGNTFLVVAGLLNFLVILDAYDIAHGWK